MTSTTNTAPQLEQDARRDHRRNDAPQASGRRDDDTRKTNWWATALIAVCSLTVLDPALPRRRRRAQDAGAAHRGHGIRMAEPDPMGELPRGVGADELPAGAREHGAHHGRRGGLHAAHELDRRLRHRAQHPPAVLQGRVLLLPGGAVHPVPDHHAAAREADRDPGAGQPGRHDHPVHDLRAVAEHLHLHRLHPLDPDRAGGGGADGRGIDLARVLVGDLPAAHADERHGRHPHVRVGVERLHHAARGADRPVRRGRCRSRSTSSRGSSTPTTRWRSRRT